MKMVEEFKNRCFKFYFYNSDFSITIMNQHSKLIEYLKNVLAEGSLSQIFYLGPGYIFLT